MTLPKDPRERPATPFAPARGLSNGHVMTVYAWARPRAFPELPPPDTRLIEVSPDTRVRADGYWQPGRAEGPTLVALHGLEGSSEVHYMRGLADQAFSRGWHAVLVNQRNCGGTEAITPGLYHSGLTADPVAVMRQLTREGRGPFVVAGYSLGGNLAIKIAGELDTTPDVPVVAVAGVCPTLDLEACVRAIERPSNFAYQWNFMRNLRGRMRRKAQFWPGAFDLAPLDRLRTIRAFDDMYTAPYHGFNGASDYYHRASAIRSAARIRIPALVLAAADDPFVPTAPFLAPDLANNPSVVVSLQAHGGHCGFIGRSRSPRERYWAERVSVDFLEHALRAG